MSVMAEQVQDNKKFTDVRLPKSIVPLNYDLWLKPDLKKFTFEGTVKIDFKIDPSWTKTVSEVILHAKDITITEGYLNDNENKINQAKLEKVIYSGDAETATLQFANVTLPSSGMMFLKFNGTLNDKMKGFYRTGYKLTNPKDGSELSIHAATTQFEATDARRCLPCWDEPAVKATFSVSITYETSVQFSNGDLCEVVALSNTPIIGNPPSKPTKPNEEVTVQFEKTPIMSTYLLAFIVGPFEYVRDTDSAGREVRVYTAPGKKEQGKFALEVACKSLPYYERYFDVKYPLPKMDLIAIPDFMSGAMENWGLVTYRESCVLVDPENTSTIVKQYIALVVAHELAHQWFGNLVTMEWWTHLWLNEGFASFMEFLCVDHIFPEYDIWSQFITDAHGRALDSDSLHNSHPIEIPVNNPSEINEIFDDISYNKGASIIRMLYNYIGDECFRKGMKDYLTRFAYKNASTEDLWSALEAASDKPVCKLMSGWTSQKGFPWLSVLAQQDGDKLKLELTQSKFTADGKLPENELSVNWCLPIATITGNDPSGKPIMSLVEGKTSTIVVENAGNSWVKLNPGNIGFYRIAYPEDMFKKLLPAISDHSLPPMDRLGLQSDFFALCQAGKIETVKLLRLLQAYQSETNYTVWSSIDSCLGRLSTLISNTDYEDKFQAYGRSLYSKIFAKLGWTASGVEKHTDALTRALVLNRLVNFGDEGVIKEAKSLYKNRSQKAIPADFRLAVYKAICKFGDDNEFNALFDIYRSTELNEEKNRVLRSLVFTKDSGRLSRVLKLNYSDEVRGQDKMILLITLGATNPPLALSSLKENKDLIRELYGNNHSIARLVRCMTENFVTEERAQEVAKFFEENKFPGAERSVQQSLETIRLNAGWLSRDKEAIGAFLSSL